MSETSEFAILLAGLSGTGKTNFLVGLDVALDYQVDPDGLIHSDHAVDREYLQPLREQWLRGEVLAHTNRMIPPTPHQLLVHHRPTETNATFHIPDLAGESFDQYFETRSFTLEFGERVKSARGILLFLHCQHNSDHEIHEDAHFMGEIDESLTPLSDDGDQPKPVEDWSIEDSSRQTRMVDLLQFIHEIREGGEPLKLAVVISAWDVIEALPEAAKREIPGTPDKFVSAYWPLLSQYLSSNQERTKFRVFGISARGGGCEPADIARLASLERPHERILMVDGQSRNHDITRPVRWILNLLD